MTIIIPPDNIVAGATGHITHHNEISDALTYVIGLTPSGDTSGSADTIALQNLINPGNVTIQLPVGTFYLNHPLVIQTNGVRLIGSGGASASGNDSSLGLGTVFKITSGYTNTNTWNGLVNGAITIIQHNPGAGTGQTNPGSNQVSGVRIRDIWVDGSSSPAAVDGIAQYGAIEASQYERVGCNQVTGKAFPCYTDNSWSLNAFPDGQHLYSCLAQKCHDHAFYGTYVDCTMVDCHAQSSNLTGAGYGDGFYINGGGNNRFVACRSDLNKNGFTFDSPRSIGASTYFDTNTLVCCGTQGNNNNGLNVINTSGSGAANRTPVIVSGGSFDGDGQDSANGAGGSAGFAAIHVEGKNDVWLSATTVNVSTQWAATGSPEYAVSSSTVGTTPGVPSTVLWDSGFMNAVTGGIRDLAPAKLMSIGPNVQAYVGSQYNGPGVAPLLSLYNAKMNAASLDIEGTGGVTGGDMLHIVNTTSGPGSPPIQWEGLVSGDRILGVKVTGDASNRFTISDNGIIQWGAGATRDIQMQRTSAGLLNITDAGAGTSNTVRVTGSSAQVSTTALFQAYCNASADLAYMTQLSSGDSFSRWRVDSNGLTKWGPGTATQDCQLSRLAGGTIGTTTTDFAVDSAGRGYQWKEGSNALAGTAPFTAGGVGTVATTAIQTGARVQLTPAVAGGSVGTPYLSTINAGTNFIMKSTSTTDTSVIYYQIWNPAP